LESQLETFLRKYPFASVKVIVDHFLITVLTIRDVFQRELEVKRFSPQ
jgi:hypothetical protein